MAKNFSDKYLSSLKPKVKMYQIREAKGFALRILPSGCKTFYFIYEVGGKRKFLNLGVYPYVTLAEARKKYNDAVEALAKGEPFVEEPPTSENSEVTTVKDLIILYMVNCDRDCTKETAAAKRSDYEKKLKEIHHRPINSITKQEAIKLIEKQRKVGDGAMRNLYKNARALFEYAVVRDYIVGSPFNGLKKIIAPLKMVERTRFLSEEELPVAWKGINECKGTDTVKRALKLVLVTAQRPGEVCGMHRREISGDWWTIPAERVKTRNIHRVFLTAVAKEIIGDNEGFIFPTPKQATSGHIERQILSTRLKIEGYFGLPEFTAHDLRRTARTHMSRIGVRRECAEAVLNHAKGGMVKVYDQYEFDIEKKEALQAWETALGLLVIQPTTSE